MKILYMFIFIAFTLIIGCKATNSTATNSKDTWGYGEVDDGHQRPDGK